MATKKSIDSLCFVFIAGGSCSGKSYISDTLKNEFYNAIIVRQDWYYLDIQFQEDDKLERFEAFDVKLLFENLKNIANNEKLFFPTYSYKLYRRINLKRPLTVKPKLVIIEGLYAIKICNLISKKNWFNNFPKLRIFIDVPEEIMLSRRLKRDLTRTNIQKNDIFFQMNKYVLPAYRNYVIKQKDKADIVFTNDINTGLVKNTREFSQIIDFIQTNKKI